MAEPHFEPIYLPPVVCAENADGTPLWPGKWCGVRVWFQVRTPQDVPPAYLNPPRRLVGGTDG